MTYIMIKGRCVTLNVFVSFSFCHFSLVSSSFPPSVLHPLSRPEKEEGEGESGKGVFFPTRGTKRGRKGEREN